MCDDYAIDVLWIAIKILYVFDHQRTGAQIPGVDNMNGKLAILLIPDADRISTFACVDVQKVDFKKIGHTATPTEANYQFSLCSTT